MSLTVGSFSEQSNGTYFAVLYKAAIIIIIIIIIMLLYYDNNSYLLLLSYSNYVVSGITIEKFPAYKRFQ